MKIFFLINNFNQLSFQSKNAFNKNINGKKKLAVSGIDPPSLGHEPSALPLCYTADKYSGSKICYD